MKRKFRMFVRFYLVIVSGILLTGFGTALADSSVDVEAALSIARLAPHQLTKIREARNVSDEEKLRRYEQLTVDFPGTLAAAEARNILISADFKNGNWQAVLAATREAVTAQPNYPSLRFGQLYGVARIVINAELPDALRREAFDSLFELLEGNGWLLNLTHNYVKRLPLSPAERYALAKKGEETCGICGYGREYLWSFLNDYIQSAEPDEVMEECERFVRRYPAPSLEHTAVTRWLLVQRADDKVKAAQRVKDLVVAENQQKTEIKQIFADASSQLESQAVSEALTTLDALAIYPGYLQDIGWNAFLTAHAQSAPPEIGLELYHRALRVIPAGKLSDNICATLIKDRRYITYGFSEALFGVLQTYLQRNPGNMRDWAKLRWFLHGIENADLSAEVLSKMNYAVADLAGGMGLIEQQAEHLLQGAILGWCIDQPRCEAALVEVSSIGAHTPYAAEAAWFLNALKQGQGAVVKGPLPREPKKLSDSLVPYIPESPTVVEAFDAFSKEGNQLSLIPLDTTENMVAIDRCRASSGQTSAAAATDRDPASAWVPETLPASLWVPLRQAASLKTIEIHGRGALQYTVTLLNANHETLAIYERDWPFVEATSGMPFWPSEAVTLNMIPVSQVTHLRVDVFARRNSGDGICEVVALQSDYSAEAEYLQPAKEIPAGQRSVSVKLIVSEPEREVTYTPDMEGVRGYPLMRWANPWSRPANRLNLRHVEHNIGVEFYGTNATLMLSGQGAIDWEVDGVAKGEIENPEKEDVATLLRDDFEDGRHMLQLYNRALPATQDTYGNRDIFFEGLKVTGKAQVHAAIRFGDGAGDWSEWLQASGEGDSIAIPSTVRGKRKAPSHYQVGVFFDTRSVLGQATPTLESVKVVFSPVQGTVALSDAAQDASVSANEHVIAARVATVRPAIVYAALGTPAEYNVAERLAKRVGAYLVSDDVGLNDYPGPILAIGTPRLHRHCRQLVARNGVWTDREFLTSTAGFIGSTGPRDVQTLDDEQAKAFMYVTALDSAGVVAAANRLLDLIGPVNRSGDSVEVFGATPLEVIYPWQMHVEREQPKDLKLSLGINDIRSLQFGLRFNKETSELSVICSDLVSARGDRLSAPQVRHVGHYEWVPFFGDLRLPDLLVDAPVLPGSANTSAGVWLTQTTAKTAKPGLYKGVVTVTGNRTTITLPIEIEVWPVELPDYGPVDFYSFASIPWWIPEGSAAYDAAVEALAENEACLRVDTLAIELGFTWQPSPAGTVPFVFDFGKFDHRCKIIEAVYARRGLPPPSFIGRDPVRELRTIHAQLKDDTKTLDDVIRLFSQQLAVFLKTSGRQERFVLKAGDEPRDMALWLPFARPYREGGVQTMTCHGVPSDLADAIGIMDPWCPNYQHNVFLPFFRERQAAGDAFWWYMCGVPATRITGTAIDNLPFYWLTAKWNFDGAMSYAALSMHRSGAEGSAVPFRYDHGLCWRIAFLPDGSILDSTRRMLESEGIQDCRLLNVVKARIEALRKATRTAEADSLQSRLDEIFETVVPYKYGYSSQPKVWETARKSLYEMAVESK